MKEIAITTNKISNASMGIWGWEIPVYLFLGGLTAGILILAALMILTDKGKQFHTAANKMIVAAPIAISIGMLLLFLDLSHKLYAWRFYTVFRITSPMSWGAWILLLVYPVSILLIGGTIRTGFPGIYKKIEVFINNSRLKNHIGKFHRIIDFSEKHIKVFAKTAIPVGVILGIYTGILLNTMIARPFWNSSILGPLFLVSGLSTAAALIVLFSRQHNEKHFFIRIDLSLIGLEVFLLSLFIISLLSSADPHIKAVSLILGGELTPVFWAFIFGFGLSIPAFLEMLELKGYKIPGGLAASLVLSGGLLLRFIILEAGQISGWLPY